MKRSFRVAALLIVASMLLALVPISASAASALTSMKVVAFGDSLTHFGESNIGTDEYGNVIYSNSYPEHLSGLIGTEVYNAGVGGNTTDNALRRIDGEVLGQNPDIVIICLGMNDQSFNTAVGTNLTSIETYRKNLELFASKIKAAGGDVVFLTPNPVCTDSGYYVARASNYAYGTNLADYCNVMREVAIKTGSTLVDGQYEYSAITLKNYMKAGDGIHQNDTGRQYFASLVAEHLKAIYDGTNKATMNIVCKDESGKELAKYTISGASGAMITVASPDLGGYSPITADVKTTFVNGATHTFVYSPDVITVAQKASTVTALQINQAVADEFFNLYNYGKQLMSAATVDLDSLETVVTKMETLISTKDSSQKILSVGASYTTDEPNYKDGNGNLNQTYADDTIRLTDGNKGYARGEDSRYSAWQGNVTIYVDLGTEQDFDVINVYAAGAEWGVGLPETFAAAYSNDGETYTSISGDSGVKDATPIINTSVDGTDAIWNTVKLSFTLNQPIKARYVKIWVPLKATCLWLDEVEVAKTAVAPTYDNTNFHNIVDGINAGAIVGGDTKVYVGPTTFSNNSGNFKWAACAVAKWDSDKEAYIINQVKLDNGNPLDITLAADEILIAAHPADNWYDYRDISTATVGQQLSLTHFDAANSVAVASVYSISDLTEPHECAPATDWKSDSSYHWKECTCGDRMFTSTHVDGEWKVVKEAEIGVEGKKELRCSTCNYLISEETIPALEDTHQCVADGTGWKYNETSHWKECSCSKHLDEDEHIQGEWKTVEPAGLDTEGKKELRCSVCNYLIDEETIPANHAPASDKWENDDTNHWKECACGKHLEEDSHKTGQWVTVEYPQVGVEGKRELRCSICNYLILEESIPALEDDHTCEPDGKGWKYNETTHWQECSCGTHFEEDQHTEGEWETVKDAEVGVEGKKEIHCSVCDALLKEESIPALEDKSFIRGDVNLNGKIDSRDYLLLKRAYFGTTDLNEIATLAADVNKNDKIDSRDYMLLKRAYFGTYTIEQ